jgi:trehalose-6-phosphate synthase
MHAIFGLKDGFNAVRVPQLVVQQINRTWNTSAAGFHTFDYARHFMSCCSRMLGLEHVASRGSISIEYYGRNVGIKIMPTGVKPERYLNGFGWQDTIWRRGELLSQVCTCLRHAA